MASTPTLNLPLVNAEVTESPENPLEDKFRDLLNIIVGSFLVSFGKVIDFWFKRETDE